MKKHYILFMMAITIAVIGAMLLAATPTVMAGDIEPTPPVPDPGLDWEWNERVNFTEEWWSSSPREWYENPAWWQRENPYLLYDIPSDVPVVAEQIQGSELITIFPMIYRENDIWYIRITLLLYTREGTYATTKLGSEIKYTVEGQTIEVVHVLLRYSQPAELVYARSTNLDQWGYVINEEENEEREWMGISSYWFPEEVNRGFDNPRIKLVDNNGKRTIFLTCKKFGHGAIFPYDGWNIDSCYGALFSPWTNRFGKWSDLSDYAIRPLFTEQYESVPLGNTFIR